MSYPRRGTLTDEQVVKIRHEYARGYKSSYQLGAEYGKTQAAIFAIVQGSVYKHAGGLITWPDGQGTAQGFSRPLPPGKVRGHCWDVACSKPIALSGWAQRMHMCEDCFRINGGKKNRDRLGKTLTLTCRVCGERFSKYVRRSATRPRCCSQACALTLSAQSRAKRPSALTAAALYEWYWGRGHTLREIAAAFGGTFSPDAVRLWLIADAIPLRAPNWRTHAYCMVDGCGLPIEKHWNGKVWYGRLCLAHYHERETRRRHQYEAEIVEARGQELAREVQRFLAGLPESVKTDAAQEIILAVLSQELSLPLTQESIKPYIVAAFKNNADAFRFISLSAPTHEGDDAQSWGAKLGLT